MKCNTCGKNYDVSCDYRQGRCPHHPPLLSNIYGNNYKMRFYNLLKKLRLIK